MTEAAESEPEAFPPPERPPGEAETPAQRRRRRWGRWSAVAGLFAVAIAAVLVLLIRLALVTDVGRGGVMAALNELELGPVGRLHVYGLKGDPLGVFSVDRLTITDQQGVWLDARTVSVRWSSLEMVLARRAHIQALHADDVMVLRRPVLKVRPPKPATKPPLGFAVDDLSLRLETRPAFSGAAGDWDIAGKLDYARSGAAKTELKAASRLHTGDGLHLTANFGEKGELSADAQAQEAAGGAIAGTLGLPVNRAFGLTAHAAGDAKAGRFELHSRSGDMSPAEATGEWSPTGGGLRGHVTLAASRILEPYAAKIGPEARFVVTAARPDAKGLQAIDARLDGQFAHAHAKGPANLAQQTSPGLSLEIQLADLKRWDHLATVGPTRAVGVFKGRLNDFTYSGKVAGDQLYINSDYAIGHAEGPASVAYDRKGLHIKAQLVGSRGAGKGLMLTLFGPAPRVQADIDIPHVDHSRINALHLQAANMLVDADGGQTLLGGFALKGRAVIKSIAGWRPGSGGGFEGGFTAAIGKNSHRWDLTFDSRGKGLKTGIAEADRLMGLTPRIAGKGTFEDGDLKLPQAAFTGAMAEAQGAVGLDRTGQISADFGWSAKGPFTAGPVEVTGDPKGRGRFTGTFARPEADLFADLSALDLGKLVIRPAHLTLAFVGGPTGMEGKASITGPSDYGIAHANAAFRFEENALALSDIVADAGGVQISGAVALRDGAPSTADLQVAARKGAFLDNGQVTGSLKMAARPGGGAAAVVAKLEARNVALPGSSLSVRSVSLSADGPLDRLPVRFSVEAPLPIPYRVTGTGVLQGATPVKVLTLDATGRVRKVDVKTTEPAVIRFGPDEKSIRLHLAGADGRADIEGSQVKGVVTAKAVVNGVAMGAFNDDYEGAISGTLSLQGKGATLGGRLEAKVAGARAKDAPPNLGLDANLTGDLANNRITLAGSATNNQGLKSRIDLELPAEAAADPFRIAINRTKPVKGAFSADGELRSLWDLLIGGDRTLAGHVVTAGTVGGTLNDLKVAGDASLSKGRFSDTPTGLVLQNLEVQARFADNQVDVTRFTGNDDAKGTVTGEGRISLQPSGGSSFQLKLNRFQLIANSLAKATASGAVTVVRDAQGHAKLSGALGIDRADVTAKPPVPTGVVPMEVREIGRRFEFTGEAQPKRSGPLQVALDVKLSAARGIFVRGRGLDAELSLDAQVGGSTSKPELSGTAHVVRGNYDFSGKRFDFDEAGTIRLGSSADTIRLDLLAKREDPALTATVRILGTAAKPQITLSSVPVLPQDEVLARVLFGVSASQLSPFQAAQLAAAVAGLASGGGFDILGNLRQFASLDRLAIGGDAAGATVTGGKYVTDNVYIELTAAGQQRTTVTTDLGRTGSSASVEWRIRKNLSIISQAWTGGDTRLSVRFRKDY